MSEPKYINLDKTKAFGKLKNTAKPSLKELITIERIKKNTIEAGGGLSYNLLGKSRYR